MILPCLYDEAQHEILSGGEVLRWAKKEAPAGTGEAERFFLYRHRLHGTFVLARWASDRKMGIFTDFLNLGYSPNLTREQANEFRKRLYAPLSAPDMAKQIAQADRDLNSEKMNEDGEDAEARLQSAGA